MAIGTYGELKSAVESWMHRADLTSAIPDLVALAESQIRRDVRSRTMEQTATGTLASSTLALPTRFLEARRVVLGTDVQSYTNPQKFYPARTASCAQYTIVGTNFVFQQADADYTIDYYQAFAPFSDDGDTNDLLTEAPEIYLFASLIEAQQYIKADPTMYIARYRKAIEDLRITEQRASFSGPLVVTCDAYLVE